MWWWLAPTLLAAGWAVGFAFGLRRGGRAWREEQRQREIVGRLTGSEPRAIPSTAPAARIRKGRMSGTHSWRN